MRWWLPVAAACASALVAAGSASAQPRLGLAVAGGPSFPLKELNRNAATGFHASVQATLLGTRAELRAEALLERFAQDGGGSLTGAGGILGAVLPVGARRTSYLLGGVGVTHLDPEGGGDSGAELTWAVGAGTRISRFFMEMRYLDSGAEARSIPVTFGVRLR